MNAFKSFKNGVVVIFYGYNGDILLLWIIFVVRVAYMVLKLFSTFFNIIIGFFFLYDFWDL